MPGPPAGDPPALFARWYRLTWPESCGDDRVGKNWHRLTDASREFWREIEAVTWAAPPTVTVDQLASALDGREILVTVGDVTELGRTANPRATAVQLLSAVDMRLTDDPPVKAVVKQADTEPRAVTLEVVERDHKTTDSLAGSIIIPSEIRINGMSVLAPADVPVRVHEMSFGADREAAVVTLTLFVRKLTVAAEGDL